MTLEALNAFGAHTDEGMARCLNDEAFYLEMVAMALEDKSFDALKAAMEAGDTRAAFAAAGSKTSGCTCPSARAFGNNTKRMMTDKLIYIKSRTASRLQLIFPWRFHTKNRDKNQIAVKTSSASRNVILNMRCTPFRQNAGAAQESGRRTQGADSPRPADHAAALPIIVSPRLVQILRTAPAPV